MHQHLARFEREYGTLVKNIEEQIMRGGGFGIIGNVVIGMLGAILGSWLLGLIGVIAKGILGFQRF